MTECWILLIPLRWSYANQEGLNPTQSLHLSWIYCWILFAYSRTFSPTLKWFESITYFPCSVLVQFWDYPNVIDWVWYLAHFTYFLGHFVHHMTYLLLTDLIKSNNKTLHSQTFWVRSSWSRELIKGFVLFYFKMDRSIIECIYFSIFLELPTLCTFLQVLS